MLKKIAAFVLITSISSQIFADQCASWGCISRIENLVLQGSGLVLVNTPLDQSVVNCTMYGNTYFVLNPNQPKYKEVYATLLSAFLTKSKIQLRIVEGSSNCEISYVRLSNAYK